MKKAIAVVVTFFALVMGFAFTAAPATASTPSSSATPAPEPESTEEPEDDFEPYWVCNIWRILNEDGSSNWPQEIVSRSACDDYSSIMECEPFRAQKDHYWIATRDLEVYWQNLDRLTSSQDDQVLTPTNWELFTMPAKDCSTPPPPLPEDSRIEGSWSAPVFVCENKVGDEIAISRDVTKTSWTYDENMIPVSTVVVDVESGVYVVTEADIKALDCVVPPVEPENPEPPVVTPEEPPVVTPVVDVQEKPLVAAARVAPVSAEATELAQTGSDSTNLIGGTIAALLAVAGGLGLLRIRKTN